MHAHLRRVRDADEPLRRRREPRGLEVVEQAVLRQREVRKH
jgi:hypothetical protein